MSTVSGNNKPISFLNCKVVGRTFYRPLLLERTLLMLPNPQQCIIPQQDLYVIVRSVYKTKKEVQPKPREISILNK